MNQDLKLTIEEQVVSRLLELNASVSTAESCTGGMIASMLVNVPGCSEVFDEGYVTYANSAKHKLLGVSGETLESFGAVSKETAEEMALGCAKAAGSMYSVVSTGIAGPDGGTIEKPVGLVWIGCCANEKAYVKECHFKGSRMEIRKAAAKEALAFFLEHLKIGE